MEDSYDFLTRRREDGWFELDVPFKVRVWIQEQGDEYWKPHKYGFPFVVVSPQLMTMLTLRFGSRRKV